MRHHLAVAIGSRSEGGFGPNIALNIPLPGVDPVEAEKLVAKALAMSACGHTGATIACTAPEQSIQQQSSYLHSVGPHVYDAHASLGVM